MKYVRENGFDLAASISCQSFTTTMLQELLIFYLLDERAKRTLSFYLGTALLVFVCLNMTMNKHVDEKNKFLNTFFGHKTALSLI